MVMPAKHSLMVAVILASILYDQPREQITTKRSDLLKVDR